MTSSRPVDKPEEKLPRRANNSKVHKRPTRQRLGDTSSSSDPKSRIIYVGTNSPFMGIVSKVRKALANGPADTHANNSTKGLPLVARLAALQASSSSTNPSSAAAEPASPATGPQHEVLVRGSGRAMAKTVELAAWFQRQPDYRISLRTMTLEAVDDVVVDEDGAQDEAGFAAEEESRVRGLSCLEVGVSLR